MIVAPSRKNPPYNGKRYLMDIKTGIIHDLDHENFYCGIGGIKHEHVEMFNSISKDFNDSERLCDKCFPNRKILD